MREDRIRTYWRGRVPEIRAILDSSRAEVRAVLSPTQRVEYDRWLERSSDAEVELDD